jgi:Skp family chaperone for outer membrane proteins
VKAYLIVVLLLVLAAAGAYVGPLLFAQQPNQPQATKIAVVNIRAVLKENRKAKALQAELEEALKPHKANAEKLAKELDALAGAKKPDAAAISIKRSEWEAVNAEILSLIEKKHEDKLPAVWNEINEAIDAVAKAYGFQIVLGYGDPDDPDLKAFQSVRGSKLRTADMGATPLVFSHNSIDITPVLIKMQQPR